ncbi:MAG: hypothetical protein IKQ73_01165 [Oscillospiraceae bacterium]|jgi:histidinol-phosphatase (PHP family)|nr:hypothetical protein [Oscillospiraceae bacterium]
MKILSTLHNHCTMCDGRSSPEEMISAAAAAGFTDFGMSCHGYAPFDPAYSIPGEEEYLTAMAGLRNACSGRLRLYTGIEEDLFAPSAMPERYDYRIGDVHYARDRSTGEFVPVDGSVEDLLHVIRSLFHGNAMDMVRDYYANMVTASEKRPLVLGHFDLITKYNERGRFFDEDSDEYRDLALQALEACLASGAVFEINSGAAAKGLRSVPYPAPFLLRRLRELGGSVTLSADCHYAPYLTAGLDLGVQSARDAGFDEILQFIDGRFVPFSLCD